ncbi:TIGR02444 family protein [Rheinheimera maricola]|uniref:TIGR02444 family protein n=1 Tax=Rheinheimera maricola TaxID=2793282 RepID=A0ABS7XCB8_9GAMM|nr:TIGR02444 family protein [Rheinheimera maricola]MBZ9612996.1 TIGR02444 family protein [Rheinheimera maricola]
MPNRGGKLANPISTEQLWQFSLALYPKVKHLCLQWQDELGANVNLLLLLSYLEQQQLSLTGTQLQQLSAELALFSTQFTQPLRQLRKNVTNSGIAPELQQPLKQSLLHAELALERLEQHLLLQHCPALTAQATPLLESYFSLLAADSAKYAAQIVDLRQSYRKPA